MAAYNSPKSFVQDCGIDALMSVEYTARYTEVSLPDSPLLAEERVCEGIG